MYAEAFLHSIRIVRAQCSRKSSHFMSPLRPTLASSYSVQCAASTIHPGGMETSDMREFYQITEKPNPQLALKAAIASAQSIDKYLQCSPIPMHTKVAFEKFRIWRDRQDARARLCIDAGCGQAWSTLRLAQLHQDCDVVGIDKSAARLHRNAAFRHGGIPRDFDNAFILQADMVHFWRLCWEHGISPDHQYILYPNPYPKSGDLKVSIHNRFLTRYP